MPVPKRKRSRARRDKRFANKGIKVKQFNMCATSTCQKPLLPHSACKECGYYKGVKVVSTKGERAERRGDTRNRIAQKAQARAAAQDADIVPENQ